MKLNRNYITPFISLVFLVVGLSGLLMLFHLFDGYTEVVHEMLGVFFIICAIFHILINWKALRFHFKKGVFIPAALAVAVISVLFILQQQLHPRVDTILLERIITAPIDDAFKVLQVDRSAAIKRLEEEGIFLEGVTTMEEIWINNDTNAEDVIYLITE